MIDYFDTSTVLRDYLIVTNRSEIRDRIVGVGITNYMMIENDLPNEDELVKMKIQRGEACFFIMYFYNIEVQHDLKMLIEEHTIKGYILSNLVLIPIEEIPEYAEADGVFDGTCLPEPMSLERYLEIMDRIIDYVDWWANNRGWILHTDYTNRCGNCHEKMAVDDKYCSVCGTIRGDGRFIPYENIAYALYGSFDLIKQECSKCGRKRIGTAFDRSSYCTECGGALRILRYKDIDVLSATDEELEEAKRELMRS